MSKSTIKSKAKVEAKGIERIRAGAEATETFKAEVKRNGKGEMKTLGLSVAEGIQGARSSAKAKLRGE